MKDYSLRQRNWLTVERLPGYVPELNPFSGEIASFLAFGGVSSIRFFSRSSDFLQYARRPE